MREVPPAAETSSGRGFPTVAQPFSPLRGFFAIVSIALFSFITFKLLAFFVTPANIVLCFLIAGHPIGVLVADRFYRSRERQALRHYVATLLFSLAALFLLKLFHPAFPAPWLQETFPIVQVGVFSLVCGLLFGPFFVFSGVVELLVLKAARGQTGKSSYAYGMILGATLTGLVVAYALLPLVGAVALAVAAPVLACSVGERRARAAAWSVGAVGFGVASALVPAIDAVFVRLVQPGGSFTARGDLNRGAKLLHSRWDSIAYTQIYEKDERVFGAYDNFPYWTAPRNPNEEFFDLGRASDQDAFVFRLLPKGRRVAVIGAGGGRQVQQGLLFGKDLRIDAFEINGTVVDYLTNANPRANGGVFAHERVNAIAEEGRRGVRESGEKYDCIYLPEAGTVLGFYKTMLVDLNLIHTREAYAEYVSQLSPDGLLASAFYRYANPNGYVTRRLVHVFRDLGLEVRGYQNENLSIVLGARPERARAIFKGADGLAVSAGLERFDEGATFETGEGPIPTDDVGLGLLFGFHPVFELRRAFVFALLLTGLIGAGAVAALVRRARTAKSGPALALAAGLGISFILLENAVILQLARHLQNLTNAVIIGSSVFLAAAVFGAVVAPRVRSHRLASILALSATAIPAVSYSLSGSAPSTLFAICVLLGAFSGAFFPILLDGSDWKLTPFLFASDSVGAFIGTLIVFFVPLLYGISTLSAIAAIGCLVAGVASISRAQSAIAGD